jgi:SAM-dependent methyltransferase
VHRNDPPDRWNYSIHYHPVILRAVPDDSKHALDVGCGEGLLARELRHVVSNVTAIDLDAQSIELARQDADDSINYVTGDVLTYHFEPASFDLVASVAALHHMGTAAGLQRTQALLRPGGTVVIVRLACSHYPQDLLLDVAATVGNRLRKLTKTYSEHSAPTAWPPPETFGETRDMAKRLLPVSATAVISSGAPPCNGPNQLPDSVNALAHRPVVFTTPNQRSIDCRGTAPHPGVVNGRRELLTRETTHRKWVDFVTGLGTMIPVTTFVSTRCRYQGTQPLASGALRPSSVLKADSQPKAEAGMPGTSHPSW